MDKVNSDNILFANKCINNLLPSTVNNWFAFVSAQHTYQTSSSAKNIFEPPFISYSQNSFQSWNNVQQKLGSLELFLLQKLNNELQMKIYKITNYCIQS